MKENIKKGIIFDLDGTLWDACAVIADSWNEWVIRCGLEEHAHVTDQDVRRACGHTMDAFADMIFPGVDKARRYDLTRECCEYEVEYMKGRGGELYPDLTASLNRLRGEGFHLYIVSNCQVGYIRDFLDWSRTAELFDDTEDFGTTRRSKDENIRLVCRRNHLDRAVYVGDTVMDYRSTCKAALPFIHAAYGFGEVPEARWRISSLRELPEAVGRVMREAWAATGESAAGDFDAVGDCHPPLR